jgi:hypothetical protein
MVTGQARVFEGQFRYRLTGTGGGVLASGTAHTTGDSTQMAPFSFPLTFSVSAEQPGMLDVYNISAKDGSETDQVQVPVTLQP